MKKFTLAVFLDHNLNIGGNFQQSLNNMFLAKKLETFNFKVIFITTKKDNIKILKHLNIDCILFNQNILSRIWIDLRESLPNFIYKILSILSKKNIFERFLDKLQVDLLYFVSQSPYASYVHSINYIYTLFDLCHRDNPEFPEVRDNRIFEFRETVFQKNLPRATAVLVDSELGKKNAINRYRLDDNRVHIFPFRNSIFLENNDKFNILDNQDEYIDIKKKYNLKYDYIFYPAQFWAHKNHLYILEALNILQKDNDISIAVIFSGSDQGNLSYIKNMTKKFKLENKVRFAGFVSNNEIKYLYSQSIALVMPTYFGPTNIPPLEAFKLGVPVLYSDLPGLREQVGNAGLLLNLKDPRSLVNNLKKIFNSEELKNTLIENGKARYNSLTLDDTNFEILKNIIDNFKFKRRTWK